MTPMRRRFVISGAILLVAALGWGVAVVVEPAIQRTIVITTGADKGIYRGFADRYAPCSNATASRSISAVPPGPSRTIRG